MLLLVFAASAAEVLPNQATINQLTSNEPLQRWVARNQLSSDRHGLIKQLLEIAQKDREDQDHFSYDKFNVPQDMAIQLLGDYRAAEAANFLVRCISLEGEGSRFSDSVLGIYPSVRALVQIGQPSINAIFFRLSPIEHLVDTNPLNERDFHLFAYVIRQIDGDEVGLFRLQLALKNATPEKQKGNFNNLIEIYKRKEDEFAIRSAFLPEPLKNMTRAEVNDALQKLEKEAQDKERKEQLAWPARN